MNKIVVFHQQMLLIFYVKSVGSCLFAFSYQRREDLSPVIFMFTYADEEHVVRKIQKVAAFIIYK